MTWPLDRALLAKVLWFISFVTVVVVAGCQPPPPEQATKSASNPLSLVDCWWSCGGGDRIFFDFDSSKISAEAKAIIDRQVAFAKTNPDLTFTIEGHCDERGTREYNLPLGARRAEAMRARWVALGIDPMRLLTVSYGNERPAVVGQNEAAWAQNRRAVAVIN